MAADGERLAWGTHGARSTRRATRRGEPAQTATTIPALLSSLSSTQSSTSARVSAQGRSSGETDCEVYRGLAYNQLDFQRWYTTRFLPRKWRPAMLAAEKRRDQRLCQLEIQALSSARALEEGQDEETLESAIKPAILARIVRLADSELLTADDHFDLLVKYVHEEANMKEAILERIARDPEKYATGDDRLQYFIESMAKSTSPVALQKAMWLGIRRQGMQEQPGEYATRFMMAAESSGRNMADKNEKFLRTVLEPWEHDPDLRAFIPMMNGLFVDEVQDNRYSHIDDMASKAFAYETMTYAKVASRWEQEGAPSGFALGPSDSPAPSMRQNSPAPTSLAAQMDLPFKDIGGKKYRACAKCKVVTGELAWHPQRLCPVSAKFKSDGPGTSAQAAQQQQPQQQHRRQVMLGESKQEFLCHMCGMPGHTRRQCDQQHQTEKGKAAEQLYWEKRRGQAPRAQQQQQRSGKRHVMFSDQDYSDRDEGPSAMEMLTQQMQQLQAAIANMQQQSTAPAPGVNPHFRGAFMAQSCDYEQWLPTSPVEGGFAFDDAYSSDGSSVMLAANPSKRFVRPGFTPLGLVPSAYVGRALRARPTPPPAPPPRPVPASARRQERMREPAHDEQRADRNRLPPGMVNPRDLPAHAVPAAADETEDEDEHLAMVTRRAQLVSLLRTSLSHTRFTSLATDIVADTSVEGAAAWQRAKAGALAGDLHNGQDPRSIAWHTAIEKAVALWTAQARLTWRDFTRIDLRAVFREAVTVTYGAAAATFLASPAEYGVPVAASPPKPPPRMSSEARANATLQQHRMQRAAWRRSIKWPGRRPVAMIDGSAIKVTINGMTASHVVLDLGANEPMIHERMVKAGQIPVDPNGRRITGITGQPHMMPRTIEALEVVICPDDSDREAIAVDSMVVMSGDTLPDCLLDNEMMAQLGIVVDPATWTASYPSRPYERDSPRVNVPLVQPPPAVLAALAQRRHDEDSVEWAGADIDAAPAAEAAVPYVMGFQGSTCFMVARTDIGILPTNLHTSQVGGGGRKRAHARDQFFAKTCMDQFFTFRRLMAPTPGRKWLLRMGPRPFRIITPSPIARCTLRCVPRTNWCWSAKCNDARRSSRRSI